MAIFYQSLQKFPSSKITSILVHGLNNKPEVLTDIAQWLESLSIPVVIVSLTGHQQDFEKLKNIKKETWQEDVLEAYTLSYKKGTKIFLIAYSLGATISLDILSEKVKFDKMILLAPAIAPRKPIQLLEYFAPILPLFPLFSIVPSMYRANSYLPLRAYDVLFQLYRSLKQKKFVHTNVPTLVIIDPNDETMSLQEIKKTITVYHLNYWKLLILDSRHSQESVMFHHLIIDKKAMGSKNWEVFTRHVAQFMNEGN